MLSIAKSASPAQLSIRSSIKALRMSSSTFNKAASTSASAPTSTSNVEDDVLFQNINNTKIITLNRPKKLNSLNDSMLQKIYPRFVEYSKSSLTELIIQTHNGRAFCAGGDVASCVENNKSGNIDQSVAFFQQEYSLNYLLAVYPKPVVSLMNGITMGGGAGLTLHTPFRIATEKTRWAMPEMDIGFSPDVGTTFALNKVVPSSFGWYLALTGENVFGWDNYFSGLATHFIPSNRLPELIKSLTNVNLKNADPFQVINNVIEDFTDPLPYDYNYKYTPEMLSLIERVFHETSTIESILQDLEADGSEFAAKTLKTLKSKPHLSLKVGLEILQRNGKTDIHEALINELNAAKQFMIDSDFSEAVSAKLIRKSKETPNWKHKELKDVSIQEILKFFKRDSSLKIDNHFNVTFNDYPRNFGLPKESKIATFIAKKDADSQKIPGDITKKDVITYFSQHPEYKHKSGLIKYLNLVLDAKFPNLSTSPKL